MFGCNDINNNQHDNVSIEDSFVGQFQSNIDTSSKTDDDETPPLSPSLLSSSSKSLPSSGLSTVLSDLQNSFCKNKSAQCVSSLVGSRSEKLIVSIPVPQRTPLLCVDRLPLGQIKQFVKSKEVTTTSKHSSSLQNTMVHFISKENKMSE